MTAKPPHPPRFPHRALTAFRDYGCAAVVFAFLTPALPAMAVDGEGPYALDVAVDAASVTAPFFPFMIDLDFAAALREAQVEGRFDPGSVRVVRMAADGGPMNVRPACSSAAANSEFSERNPYPGWTAWAPVRRAASTTAGMSR